MIATNLPELTGSQAQIERAAEIRRVALDGLTAERAYFEQAGADEDLLAGMDRLAARMASMSEAGWWLDSRAHLCSGDPEEYDCVGRSMIVEDPHWGVWVREAGLSWRDLSTL